VGVRVGERSETVVIFLTSGIPEGELDVLAVHLDIGNVVLENGGDVDLTMCVSIPKTLMQSMMRQRLRHMSDKRLDLAAHVVDGLQRADAARTARGE
jgi:hypothetical protein